MAPQGMIPKSRPSSPVPPGTPPDSPELSPPTSFTLSNAQQLIDLVKAIAAMDTVPNSVKPHCHCYQIPSNSPALHTASPPVTREDLKQLLLEVIQEKSKPPEAVRLDAQEDETQKIQALKLEFKKVNEVWDKKSYQYKIVESLIPKNAIEELDQYVFVVRVRIDRNTEERTTYIDIKSEVLRDILRTVLNEVHGMNLGEDKPTVEADLLYHYLPELGSHWSILNDSSDNDTLSDDSLSDDDSLNDDSPDNDSPDDCSSNDGSSDNKPDDGLPKLLNVIRKEHLNLLIEHIKTTYAPTTHSLFSLQESKEITYDLLWALFKPGALVYTTCFGSKKPRCVIYDSAEQKTSNFGVKYYSMECRYLDFNGEVFGEVSINLGIPKFHGTKRINSLEAFPLQYHSNESAIRAGLLQCGQKFVSLIGSHHRHYCGEAFAMVEGEPTRFSVNGRIMIDAAFFRKVNPNYSRPSIIKPEKSANAVSHWAFGGEFGEQESEPADQIQSHAKVLADMTEIDFLICCPTMLGFSLNDKIWGEFAVADIKDIEWSNSLFNCLSIPSDQKDAIMALAETHMGKARNIPFDDFVTGKGRGLVILLHGPPGVGKTLTAEAVSEHLKRPLYSISAGELQISAADLEYQLTRISESAKRWKALLLLDEADVYVEQRSSSDLVRNSLVSVFLRKLEFCEGIMFLTTNRVSGFDMAILSRVHLMFKYDDLSKEAGGQIWKQFIERAGPTKVTPEELNLLVNNKLNGRQIKNAMATAHAMATKQKSPLLYSHLRTAVDLCKNFIHEFNGGAEASGAYR